jgi:hypothetical protein
VATYEDLLGHHLLSIWNLVATTNDESYHGSASELPPATWHGYMEWDFSSAPDPVMFWRFLDAADYWLGYYDDSSVGSYDPTCECFVFAINEHADRADEVGDGDVPRNPEPNPPPAPPVGNPDIAA